MKTILGVLGVTFVSCAPQLPLSGAACPCAEGWFCCPQARVCVAEETACPAPPAPVVQPAVASVSVTRRFNFTAADSVTWSVEESAGGTIDASGLYAAPASPGTFHVVATLQSDPAISTRIEVTVVPLRLEPLAGRYGGCSSVPIDGVGDGARLSGPHGGAYADGFFYFLDNTAQVGMEQSTLRRLEIASGRVETLFIGTRRPNLELVPVSDGPRTQATLSAPSAISADGHGHLIISDACLVRSLTVSDLSVETLHGDPRLTSCSQVDYVTQGVSDGDDLLYFTTQGDRIWQRTLSSGAEQVFASPFNEILLMSYDDERAADPTSMPRLVVVDLDTVRAVSIPDHVISTESDYPVDYYVGIVGPPASPRLVLARVNGDFEVAGGGGLSWLTGNHTGVAAAATGDTPGLKIIFPDDDGAIYRLDLQLLTVDSLAGRPEGPWDSRDGNGQAASFDLHADAPLASAGDEVFVAELSGLVRKTDRRGNVTTLWPRLPYTPAALAVDGDDLLVAGVDLGQRVISRAPRAGGAWQRLAELGTLSEAIEAMFSEAPGQLLLLSDGTIWRFDRSTGQLTAIVAVGDFRKMSAGPPGTALLWTEDRIVQTDLMTGMTSTVIDSSADARLVVDSVTYDHGAIYFTGDTVLRELDTTTGSITMTVGVPGRGAVIPGPLTTALLHAPGPLTVLPNGDVVVLDTAERALMVVR
jgi:hypothetical protein